MISLRHQRVVLTVTVLLAALSWPVVLAGSQDGRRKPPKNKNAGKPTPPTGASIFGSSSKEPKKETKSGKTSLKQIDWQQKSATSKGSSTSKKTTATTSKKTSASKASVNAEYWKRTLEEIRSLAVPKQRKTGNEQALTQWKKFSTGSWRSSELPTQQSKSPLVKPPARYDGFGSWERLVQEWSDDVQEYLDKIEESTTAGSLASYFNVSKAEVEAFWAPFDTKQQQQQTQQQEKAPRPIPATRKPGEAVLPHTDISDKSKRIWIVTTAALPWMTGTAVNPLLRAAYMTTGRKEAGGSVTLMLPWLERQEDQERVYGKDRVFDTPQDQETYIRNWLKSPAKMEEASEELNIEWYTAWQNRAENSLYSMGDIVATISEDDVDIMVLEEPEHLNWYRAPGDKSWTQKFKHVVGIIHTNYFVYAQEQPAALVRAPAMKLLCTWMCRSHCHRIIKLSGTLPQYAPEKELIENVHGVRGTFLDIGDKVRTKLLDPSTAAADPVFAPDAEATIYFIGKMLWSKGIGTLMELIEYAEETTEIKLKVDMYGGGPDKDEASARAKKAGLDMPFHGPIDHAELAMSHKVFVNPSLSEVLCTTVSEALAMGKFVVLPSHPSNDFFAQFPNCLPYANKEEFVGNLYYALSHSPAPLSEEYSYALSWQAATERFEAAGCIPLDEAETFSKWVDSGDAGVEITLPPLIENEAERKRLASRMKTSRESFRKFRDSLAKEITFTKVLPRNLRSSIVAELDKRLDLDIDELLESPKLEVKLSPAELDKQCLELYERVAKGPGGDVLRVIGGGQEVGMQSLYMQKQAQKGRRSTGANATIPFFLDADEEKTADERTASQWVQWTMRQNLKHHANYKLTAPPPPKTMKEAQSRSGKAQKGEKNINMSLRPSVPNRPFGLSQTIRSDAWSGLRCCPPSACASYTSRANQLSSRCATRSLSLLI